MRTDAPVDRGGALHSRRFADGLRAGVLSRTLPALLLLVVLPAAGTIAGQLMPSVDATLFPTAFYAISAWIAIVCGFVAWTASALLPRRGVAVAALCLGYCLGAASLWAIVTLPALPVFLILTLIAVGVLALAPYSCIAGGTLTLVALARHWHRRGGTHGTFRVLVATGALVFALSVVLYEYRSASILRNVSLATSADPAVAVAALDRLEADADPDELLRACYEGARLPRFQPFAFGTGLGAPTSTFRLAALWLDGDEVPPASAEDCRRVFFQLYGVPYSSFRAPPLTSGRTDWGADRDFERGDDGLPSVAAPLGTIPGLQLAESTFEATADARNALAFVSWTMRFLNDDMRAHEARMSLIAPPQSTASQLSLWVNGVEQQAAFGPTQTAKEAYRDVAYVQRTDPALLTLEGPDRLRLLVFPVPARGDARVRVGFTVPLFVDDPVSLLRLPGLLERNFAVVASLRHSVRIVADAQPRPPVRPASDEARDRWDIEQGSKCQIRGSLSHADLLEPARRTFTLPAAAVPSAAYSSDASGVALQELHPAVPLKSPANAVVVIDGRRSVLEAIDIDAMLATWPPGTTLTLVWASRASETITADAGDDTLRRWLRDRVTRGGIDPVPALERALDLGRKAADARVVWLHGIQPHVMTETHWLARHWGLADPPLIAVAVEPGRNAVLDALRARIPLHVAPRLGTLAADLARTQRMTAPPWADCATIDSSFSSAFRKLSRLPAGSVPEGAPEASGLISRLWAAAESAVLSAAGKVEQATEIALANRLVTAVSAAVVLERREQYARHGLDPEKIADVEPSVVPNGPVPEPETWIMLLIGCALVAWVHYRRRRVASALR